MTDQIELPPVPQSPPIVTLDGYGEDDADAVIKFDPTSALELVVNLTIRDENLSETLKMRWKIESGRRPSIDQPREYPCPGEPEIPGDGVTLRRKKTLPLAGDRFALGSCNRVDVIVSANFKTCRPDRDDDWDVTTQEEDDDFIGRKSFWVWAYNDATNPFLQPALAVPFITSCEQLDYQPPSPTASSTSAATTGM